MAVQTNFQTSADALNVASMATQRGSESLRTSVDTVQKMRENREWASEEQKKMRSQEAKTKTAVGRNAQIVAEQESGWIENNLPIYQEMIKSGVWGKMTESWKSVSDAETETFYKYGADVDFSDPEQASQFLKNLSKDPIGRQMVGRLPNSALVEQGDKQSLAELSMLQGTMFNSVDYRQKLGLQQQQGKIQSGLQKEAAGFESRHIQERGGVQMGLQQNQQRFQASQNALDRTQRREEFDQTFGLKGMEFAESVYQFDETMKLQRDKMEKEYDAAMAKAKADGKTLKVKDALGESAKDYRQTAAPFVVNQALLDNGIDFDIGDEEDAKLALGSLSSDIFNQASAAWEDSNQRGVTPEHPGKIMEAKIDGYVAAGVFTPGNRYSDAKLDPKKKAAYDRLDSKADEELTKAYGDRYLNLTPVEKEKAKQQYLKAIIKGNR